MKTEIEAVAALPTAVVLVGATVEGKPTYTTIAWVGIIGRTNIAVSVHKQRYINRGIKENQSFSVNLPSEDLVKETDYCGIKTGREVDKASLFRNFYGKLQTAPMIQECPINMECKVVKTFDTPTHDVFIGEVVSTYSEEAVLVDGKLSLGVVNPFFYSMTDKRYWRIGKKLANAREVGEKVATK